jgi:hypothetical protein
MREDIKTSMFENRPATKGDYQLPESIDADTSVDNDLLNWWSEHSFEQGYGQEQFEQGIEKYALALNAGGPDPEAEVARLGDNAAPRAEAAGLFARTFFPEAIMPAIERMCETADGVFALEHIMEKSKTFAGSEGSDPSPAITAEDLATMSQDERYWNVNKRDAGFVKKVDEGFERLYAKPNS